MIINNYGREADVEVLISSYESNGNMAVVLMEDGELFGTLTVNPYYPLPWGVAFVDINNMPGAEEFIRENDLGHIVEGSYYQSGFCLYPKYIFKLDKLKNMRTII